MISEHIETYVFLFQSSYGVRNNGRILIADDMGLGKTIQAISLASYYRSDWPVLVVTPSSVKVAWAKVRFLFVYYCMLLSLCVVEQIQHVGLAFAKKFYPVLC